MSFVDTQNSMRRSTNLLLFLYIVLVFVVSVSFHVLFVLIQSYLVLDNTEANLSFIYAFKTLIVYEHTMIYFTIVPMSIFILTMSAGKAVFLYFVGGKKIATSLGGVKVLRETDDKEEKMLLNVVDEISIASGLISPSVYIMNEDGINAFAAGFGREDSIISVTRGALTKLTRDELQGVVAHEFSHIINNDIRLNMYASSLIFGFLSIIAVGRMIIRLALVSGSSRDGRAKVAGLAVGAGVMLVGSVGWLGGFLLQKAISRRREYLADATAVQYTRNPSGITGALIKIGNLKDSSVVTSGMAGSHAHMFFSNIKGTRSFLSSLVATHPPLTDRVFKLTGKMYKQNKEGFDMSSGLKNDMSSGFSSSSGYDDAEEVTIKDNSNHLKDSSNVVNYVLKVKSEIPDNLIPKTIEKSKKIAFGLASNHKLIKSEWRLVLIDLIIPFLRDLSTSEYSEFRLTLTRKIKAFDKESGMTSRSGFMLNTILLKQLDLDHGMRKRISQNGTSVEAKHIGLLFKFISDSEDSYNAGKSKLNNYKISDRNSYTVSALLLNESLKIISRLNEDIRQEILDGCIEIVYFDGIVTIKESESLRSIATAMDILIPLDILSINK